MNTAWKWLVKTVKVFYVKRRCRALVKSAGFSRSSASPDWICHQCDERLDEVQSVRIIHTFAGETFKYPLLVATMCSRCAWVADGEIKMPVWTWLRLRGCGSSHRISFLKNEQTGLRIRLAEIEKELHPRKTLVFEDKRLRGIVAKLKKDTA